MQSRGGDAGDKPVVVGPPRLLERPAGGSTTGIDVSDERKAKLELLAMAPYERHKLLVNTFLLMKPGDTKLFERDTSRDRNPYDALCDQHRFVWKAKDSQDSWEARLAKRYYDLLFREYAICDLSRYKAGLVAMRWQTEKEVESGKGQFICGHRTCSESNQLRTWEVPFQYEEQGEKRTELVKLRLCPVCSKKLNFKRKRREVTKSKKKTGERKRKRDESESECDEPTKLQARTEEEEKAEKEKVAEEEKKKQLEIEAQAASIWGGPAPIPEEEARTREDEFQAYLEDLFF